MPEPIDSPIEEIDVEDPDPDRREISEPYDDDWFEYVEVDTTTELEEM